MYAKLFKAAQGLLIFLGALLAGPDPAISGQPVHAVRGHAIYHLDPPAMIEQITINASADENGAVTGSIAVFPSVYLSPPIRRRLI